ncbi:hypothetical protein GOODEAATRI_006718, partial [Goodea atripinnis]
DLSLELEATFAHRQSVSNEAARLLHLMEVDCPGLRGQVLRTAVDNCQQVLDLMSQPGPKMVEAEVQAYRLERTTFAENLGSIRLQWLLLQRELDSQGDVRRIQEVSAALQELKKVRVHYEKQEKLLCDVIFSDEAESVRNACGDLYQQVKATSCQIQTFPDRIETMLTKYFKGLEWYGSL